MIPKKTNTLLYSSNFLRSLISLSAITIALLVPDVAIAHTPHIDVACIRFLDLPDGGRLLFAIVRENLWLSASGKPWRRLWRGLPFARCRDLAISDRLLILATDAGIYYSADRGGNWHGASYPSGYFFAADALRLVDAPDPSVTLAAAENSTSMLCLTSGGVLRSFNGGQDWSEWHCGHGRATAALARDGRWTLGFSDGVVIAFGHDDGEIARWSAYSRITTLSEGATDGTLYAATDGGGVWRLPTQSEAHAIGPIDKRITCLATLPAEAAYPSGRLAAATWRDGVYILNMNGGNWTLYDRGLTREAQADDPSFRAPQFRRLLYCPGPALPCGLLLAGFDGLFWLDDSSGRWSKLETGVTTRIIVGVAALGSGRVALSMYGAGTEIIDCSRTPQTTARALQGLRTFAAAHTRNTGGADEVWVAAHDVVHVLDRRGRKVRTAPLLDAEGARAPRGAALRRRVVPYAKRSVNALPTAFRNLLRAFIVRRGGIANLRIRFAAFGSQFAVPKDFRERGVAFLGTFREGLFVTRDFGESFYSAGLGGAGVLHDVAVAQEPRGDCALFAATDVGLRVSYDTGESWQILAEDNCAVIRTAATYGADGFVVFAATWSTLYRGEQPSASSVWSWQSVLDDLDGHPVTEISLSPDFGHSRIVIVNIAGHGLYRSTDGGKTFVACSAAETDGSDGVPEAGQLPAFPDSAGTITFDPDFLTSGMIWAVVGTVLRESKDRGRTWKRII